MQSGAPPVTTILSSLDAFQKNDLFSYQALHPFSSAAPATCDLLQDLINTADQVHHSLEVYSSSAHWSNSKLISLLRQHTSIEHTSYSSAKNIKNYVDGLSQRPNVMYGESVPLISATLPQWCVDQLAAWGKSVGMETFVEVNREGGGFLVILGGKVLVIDVDFIIDNEDPLKPILKVVNAKTGNALISTPTTSSLLGTFLADSIAEYCSEMQKGEDDRNILHAATIRKKILDYLRYLVLLDRLAIRKDDGGIRWFTDIDEFCPTMIGVAKSEAEAVASSLSLTKTPLDIFLLRSHSLPLPYLTSPSISFLTYLSPSAYLSLLRKAAGKPPEDDAYPTLDISVPDLKSNLDILDYGVVRATLSVEKLSEAHLYPASMSMSNSAAARPTFPLSPSSADLDHSFPQIDTFNIQANIQDSGDSKSDLYAWTLDFTERGKRPGVVMSQSRMKAIELVVNPLSGGDGVPADALAFSTGSWVDLLLNNNQTVSPERYTAIYRSPNNLHPPLQLRLTAPEEPGFILERIPVHSIKEIWGILEVVREQCWVNGILLSCHWTAEGLKSEEDNIPDDETGPATEDELQAILTGSYTPRKIPVNVFILPPRNTDNLFGSTELDFPPSSGPRIMMTSPERSPISGLVTIAVSHDETKLRGVSVEVQGAMGSDLKPADLEEICRRGGTLGLSGRVWASGHHHMLNS